MKHQLSLFLSQAHTYHKGLLHRKEQLAQGISMATMPCSFDGKRSSQFPPPRVPPREELPLPSLEPWPEHLKRGARVGCWSESERPALPHGKVNWKEELQRALSAFCHFSFPVGLKVVHLQKCVQLHPCRRCLQVFTLHQQGQLNSSWCLRTWIKRYPTSLHILFLPQMLPSLLWWCANPCWFFCFQHQKYRGL